VHIKGDTFPWDTVWNYQENVDDLIAVAANTFDLAISVSIMLCPCYRQVADDEVKSPNLNCENLSNSFGELISLSATWHVSEMSLKRFIFLAFY